MKRKRQSLIRMASMSLGMICLPLCAMEVELTTQVEGGFRPTIKASSNLPDGMKLLVRVTRKESAFQLETPVEVQSGHFEVGPLSQSGDDLNPGIYELEIFSVNPADQRTEVKQLYGASARSSMVRSLNAMRASPGYASLQHSKLGRRQTQNLI